MAILRLFDDESSNRKNSLTILNPIEDTKMYLYQGPGYFGGGGGGSVATVAYPQQGTIIQLPTAEDFERWGSKALEFVRPLGKLLTRGNLVVSALLTPMQAGAGSDQVYYGVDARRVALRMNAVDQYLMELGISPFSKTPLRVQYWTENGEPIVFTDYNKLRDFLTQNPLNMGATYNTPLGGWVYNLEANPPAQRDSVPAAQAPALSPAQRDSVPAGSSTESSGLPEGGDDQNDNKKKSRWYKPEHSPSKGKFKKYGKNVLLWGLGYGPAVGLGLDLVGNGIGYINTPDTVDYNMKFPISRNLPYGLGYRFFDKLYSEPTQSKDTTQNSTSLQNTQLIVDKDSVQEGTYSTKVTPNGLVIVRTPEGKDSVIQLKLMGPGDETLYDPTENL